MLWIISGSYHSGKNTLRNILATDYGFTVIKKYVEEETAGNTFKYGDDEVASRDPFLLTNNDEAGAVIHNLKDSRGNDISNAKFFIFEKTRGQYYLISKNDIATAIKNDDENYVLVCSEPNTVQKIRDLKIMKESGSEFSAAEKSQRIKAILIFGLNLKESESPDKKAVVGTATKKFSAYISYMVDHKNLFDFVIFNKNVNDPGKLLQSEWNRTYIMLAQSLKLGEYRPFIYKLVFNKEDTPKYRSSIFFVKPFPNPGSLRPNEVFKAVNNRILQISKKVGPVKIDKLFSKQSIDYSMDCAEIVEYREGNENPWAQMRQQIEEANLVIVDVADIDNQGTVIHKPNCYWELGYARALCKNIIVLVDQNANKIEFDEQDKIYIQYELQCQDGKCVFIPQDSKRNNLGVGDNPKAESYSFDNVICAFYTRLKKAMEASYLNRIILMKAATEDAKEKK